MLRICNLWFIIGCNWKKKERKKRDSLSETVQTGVTKMLKTYKNIEIDWKWCEVAIYNKLNSFNERVVEVYLNIYRIIIFWVMWLSRVIWLLSTKLGWAKVHGTDTGPISNFYNLDRQL